jgi:hypothetical protein
MLVTPLHATQFVVVAVPPLFWKEARMLLPVGQAGALNNATSGLAVAATTALAAVTKGFTV